MNGIYFDQGREAAKTATSLEQAQELCPHGQRGLELQRRQVWMNGFAYQFNANRAAGHVQVEVAPAR